jgi:WD40 repeat protein
VLGYPGEISKPLDADHHGVCKYDSREDPRYITVRNMLKSLVSMATPKRTGKPHLSDVRFEELLSVLESPETDLKSYSTRRTAGTCDWILQHSALQGWLGDAERKPHILWIYGSGASGKSILSSFIINSLIQDGQPCHYFFVRFEDKKKRALSTILRSLAAQLSYSIPEYALQIRQLEAAGTDLRSTDAVFIWQILFRQTLFTLNIGQPLYWVVDGIDEADNPKLLINLLSELHAIDIPLRILIVGRKTHDITDYFRKLSKRLHTEQIALTGNQSDFQQHIDQHMTLAADDAYREEVVAEILRRAQGNFLWVDLAVKRVNQCQTKPDVSDALKDLPPGMEALYRRMANSVRFQPSSRDPTLGERILGWAAYAQRPLSVEELCDALGNDEVLEIHRTIEFLCGGFVIVNEGKVALIHETAREYLVRSQQGRVFLEKKATNDKLFKRCIARLMDPSIRQLIDRGRAPALLDYAAGSWFLHLAQGSLLDEERLRDLVTFFQGQPVLTWIHMVAKKKQLRSLVVASRYLNEIVLKSRQTDHEESLLYRQAMVLLTSWAGDLVKVVGKFGISLVQKPEAIFKHIPPFCPEDSLIYQQFGQKERKTLHVSGFTNTSWDDCLGRLALEQGVMASAVRAAGNRILILTNRQNAGRIFVYNSVTLEEEGCLTHPERVYKIQVDAVGEYLVSYGYKTTRVWTLADGECIKTVNNPTKRTRPQSILVHGKSRCVLVCGEDRCVRSFNIDDEGTDWEYKVKIEEQSQEDTYTVLNAPTCSALSPDGDTVAFGYRGHPVTVWNLSTSQYVGQCNMTPEEGGVTDQTRSLGETTQLRWHPFNNEIFGLQREGLLFKWDPYEEETSVTVQAGAHFLAVSQDGSLLATGDTGGTVKVFTASDLTLVYQLSSQDHVLDISFSTDSRRLYDIRGSFGNVWEPNALIRLAESSEYSDHSSDGWSETDTIAKTSLQTEHHSPRVDTILSLSGQPNGPLYCYGTEDGIVTLCETGKGKVCEMERLANFMSIEHISWSDDGQFVAIVDLSAKVSIKRVTRGGGESQQPWKIQDDFQYTFPSNHSHIRQILFQPNSHRLLVVSLTGLYRIDVTSHSMVESVLPSDMPGVRWISHPTQSEYLLAFSNTRVYIFSWEGLQQVTTQSYLPRRISKHAIVLADHPMSGRGSFRADDEVLGRVISSIGSPEIMLEIFTVAPSQRLEAEYLMFTMGNIDIGVTSTPSASVGELEQQADDLFYMPLAAEVASRVREPLSLLSRGRFVFLDVDKWICTWRLPTKVPTRATAGRGSTGGRGSEAGVSGLDQLYFLPGDWITANEVHLSTVLPNGTFLCPRNGDVATVECAKMKR